MGRARAPAERPKHMPSSRLAARLGQLAHSVLAELAAQLCSERPALQAAAEECIAANSPLPLEMVERVLLSPDLVPCILGPLLAKDGVVAAVCSHWLAGWQATNEAPWPRRRLKQVPLDLPEEIDTCHVLSMTATPDGRLVVRTAPDERSSITAEVRILDRSMCVLHMISELGDRSRYLLAPAAIAADDDSIFYPFSHFNRAMGRSNYSGTTIAACRSETRSFFYPVLAPTSGLLFCVIRDDDYKKVNRKKDEIIALDAQTLQLRHRFGLGLLDDASQPAVVGDELYVCDTNNDRLQVFSLTGEHRRSVTGAWRSPEQLCFAKGRLYLVEQVFHIDFYDLISRRIESGELNCNEDVDEVRRVYFDQMVSDVRGHRVLVLSLQGEILGVITHPTDSTVVFTSICCFDGKLIWQPTRKMSLAGRLVCSHCKAYSDAIKQTVRPLTITLRL